MRGGRGKAIEFWPCTIIGEARGKSRDGRAEPSHPHPALSRRERVLSGAFAVAEVAEAAVKIAAGDQLVVGARVDNLAMVHDHNAVGQRDHARAMGDHEGSTVAGEFLQHLEDELFAFKVDLAGGFVEQEDFGVAENGAGERDSLPLATGEAAAGGPDERLVAAGQLVEDEAMGVSGASGGFDFGHRRIGFAVADVVLDRVVEHQDFLRDESEALSQVAETNVANIGSFDGDAAAGRVVEAWQELHERSFAAAVGADDGDGFAGANFQVDAAEHGFLLEILEADVFKLERTLERRQGNRANRIEDFLLAVEHFVHAVGGGDGLLDVAEFARQAAAWVAHAGEHCEKDAHVAMG